MVLDTLCLSLTVLVIVEGVSKVVTVECVCAGQGSILRWVDD